MLVCQYNKNVGHSGQQNENTDKKICTQESKSSLRPLRLRQKVIFLFYY
uniref:Uncharacterized protein n=1 Tax=Rhizophora mucronata TaxID=61149 RepID=A0A2P2NRI4_RHIMU